MMQYHSWLGMKGKDFRMKKAGTRQYNLKNITVELPPDKLIVITGLFRVREVHAGIRYYLAERAEAIC